MDKSGWLWLLLLAGAAWWFSSISGSSPPSQDKFQIAAQLRKELGRDPTYNEVVARQYRNIGRLDMEALALEPGTVID